MHAFAIVILPEEATETDAGEWVTKLLAAGDENLTDDGWWDWWHIGGRWDGTIQHTDRYAQCHACATDTGDCHYSAEHEQIAYNLAPVRDLGELDFYRIVCPDGTTLAQEDFSRAPGEPLFADRDYTVPGFREFAARALVTYRDRLAVGIDYHS